MPQLTDTQSLVQRPFSISTFSRAYHLNAYIGYHIKMSGKLGMRLTSFVCSIKRLPHNHATKVPKLDIQLIKLRYNRAIKLSNITIVTS